LPDDGQEIEAMPPFPPAFSAAVPGTSMASPQLAPVAATALPAFTTGAQARRTPAHVISTNLAPQIMMPLFGYMAGIPILVPFHDHGQKVVPCGRK
jgi:hypothetical protein